MKNIINFVKSKWWLILIIVIVAAIAGFVIKSQIDASKITGPTTKVSIDNLTETITASGYVDAHSQVSARFSVPSKVTWVGIKKGDQVKKYQGLAKTDSRIAQKNLEKALLAFQTNRWNFDQNREDLQANGKNPIEVPISKTLQRDLQKDQFSLDSTIKDVEISRITVSDSYLSTPISGTVVDDGDFKVGENLSGTDIASRSIKIIDFSTLFFRAEIDEVDFGKVKLGQKVNVVLDAFPDQTISGTITNIDRQSFKTNSGSLKVKAEIKLTDLNPQWVVGLNGEAKIIVNQHSDTLVIPRKSVTFDGNQAYVWLKSGDKKVKKNIEVGLSNDQYWQVKSGLAVGDEITF